MASPFLAGFPGGLMQGLDFGTQQALRQLQLKQAQQEMLQADQQQQSLGVAAQALRQIPQQPTGFQQGAAQDITTSLSGGFPQGSSAGGGMLAPGFSRDQSGQLTMGGQPPTTMLPGGIPAWQTGGSVSLPQFQDEIFNLESGRGRNTQDSPAGAVGPMQIMPQTAAGYGVGGAALRDPQTNMQLGNRIVGDLYSKYGGNPDLTAIAYNAGPGRADKIAAGAPLSSLPSETQNYLAKMHRDLDLNLGQNGGKLIQAGMPAPAVQQSTQTAKAAGREIDPSQWGTAQLHTLMQAIDKVAPDAPDAVKMLALGQINKLAAPEDRLLAQMYMKENAQQIQVGLAEFRAEQAERGRQEATQRSITIESMREGAAAGRQERAAEIKAAQADQGSLDPETLSTMADQYLAGDRTVMQNLGRGAQGSKNIVALRGEIAKKMAEAGMSGQDMATKMAEFEGLKAGERTLTQRTANIGMRIAEAKTFAPLALAASEKVDRTQFPTLNSLLLAAEKGTGNEDVVRLSVATQSLLNAYAAAVTPTGVPTEGAQSRAHELLDKAWSQGQFRVAIDQLMKEMDAASKSPGIVREEFRSGAAAPAKGGQPITGPTSGGMPGAYASPTDVEKAFMTGKITKEQAQQILVDQFGAK